MKKGDGQIYAAWTRRDWRESIFSPRIPILQALTKSGATASGLGASRRDALDKCLSETAEILAVAQFRQSASDTGAQESGFDPMDGLSAHPDPALARLLALYEAHERIAVSEWWLGLSNAEKVPETWLHERGISDWVAELRQSAAIKRITNFWRLTRCEEIEVVICISNYRNGQDPIPGFGASVSIKDAIRKAFRENLLMELNLAEVLAARSGYSEVDMSRVETKIINYTARRASILPNREIEPPVERNGESDIDRLVDEMDEDPIFIDIAPPWMERSVWRCRIPKQKDFQPRGRGSPFF